MTKIDYKNVITQLMTTFPQCFHWEKPKPLKIGIFNEIRATFEQTPEQWADVSLLQIPFIIDLAAVQAHNNNRNN